MIKKVMQQSQELFNLKKIKENTMKSHL